jgi:hypothetical protein
MRRPVRVLGFALAALALAACATNSSTSSPDTPAGSEAPRAPGTMAVSDEEVLQGPPCSVDDPGMCPEGTTCASLALDTGRRSICVDPQKVCEQLQCGKGQCVILESYPIQVRCAE